MACTSHVFQGGVSPAFIRPLSPLSLVSLTRVQSMEPEVPTLPGPGVAVSSLPPRVAHQARGVVIAERTSSV